MAAGRPKTNSVSWRYESPVKDFLLGIHFIRWSRGFCITLYYGKIMLLSFFNILYYDES